MNTNRRECLLLMLMLAISLPPAAKACSCAQSSLPKFYEQADVVFLAEILQIFRDEEPDRWLNPVKATFNVLETYKGEPTFPEIITPQNSAACGVEMFEGGSYLFFASSQGGVSICNGSGSLSKKLHYVKALNRFQSGAIDELVEPWAFNKFKDRNEAYCALSRVVGNSGHGSVSFWKFSSKYEGAPTMEGGFSLSFPEPLQVFVEDAYLLVGDQMFVPTARQNERTLQFAETDILEVIGLLQKGASMSAGPMVSTDEHAEQLTPMYWNISVDDLGSTPNRFLKCLDWIDKVWEQGQDKVEASVEQPQH